MCGVEPVLAKGTDSLEPLQVADEDQCHLQVAGTAWSGLRRMAFSPPHDVEHSGT